MSASPLGPQIIIESFGFLHEVPTAPTGALLIDLRTALRDPHIDPAMRQLTGLDDAVVQNVLAQPGAFEVVNRTIDQALGLLAVNEKRNLAARVLVGCQGGRHRSVVVADAACEAIRARGIRIEVEHLHVGRPVVER